MSKGPIGNIISFKRLPFIIKLLTRLTLLFAKYPCQISPVNQKQCLEIKIFHPPFLCLTCVRRIASAPMEGNLAFFWVILFEKLDRDEPNLIGRGIIFQKRDKNYLIQRINAARYLKKNETGGKSVNSIWVSGKHSLNALLWNSMMLFVWGSYQVSMQQLECKSHGCYPEKQFAFRSTTCIMLTYLLEV